VADIILLMTRMTPPMGIFGSDTKRTWDVARFEGELKMVTV
jgi:hypothetical protein